MENFKLSRISNDMLGVTWNQLPSMLKDTTFLVVVTLIRESTKDLFIDPETKMKIQVTKQFMNGRLVFFSFFLNFFF